MSTTQETYDVMSFVYSSAAKNEVEAATKYFAEDIVIYEPAYLPYGGTYRGLAEFGECASKASHVLDLSGMVVERIVAQDDRSFSVIRIPQLQTGEDLVFVEAAVVRDKKIVELKLYFYETGTLIDMPKL